MARKAKRAKRTINSLVQLKVRLPEPLRRDLERAATRNGHSMNVEAVKRLRESFQLSDQTDLIVDMLLKNLDDAVIDRLVNKVNREVAEDMQADIDKEYFEDLERSK